MPDNTTNINSAGGAGGKTGVGVGSASIVLIFAVLCLTVFTLITYIVASNHKALVDAETELVTGYYAADSQAERILDWLIATGESDGSPEGIDVNTAYDESLGADTTYFYCPVNDIKALYVNIHFSDASYEILSWRMVDLNEWQLDNSLNIWDGF